MKKFLSKKPVMISFVVAAVLFLAVYIGMLVRPVSYGFNYVQKETETFEGVEYKETEKINIKSDKVLRLTSISQKGEEKEKTEITDMWIYRDGKTIVVVGIKEYIEDSDMTKEELEEENKSEWLMDKTEYEAKIEEIEKTKKDNSAIYKAWLEERGFEANVFKAESGENEKGEMEYAQNTQAIVFTVVHGVVTVALLAFAGLAVYYAVKKK